MLVQENIFNLTSSIFKLLSFKLIEQYASKNPRNKIDTKY